MSTTLPAVQGWFGGLWPLWCPSAAECTRECLGTPGFWVLFSVHCTLFYATAMFVGLLRSCGLWPRTCAENRDKGFDSVFYIAWHIPISVVSIPMSLMSLQSAWELWQTGDTQKQFGAPVANPFVIEAGAWFISYLIADTFIITLHRLADKEMYVHHAIFAVVTLVILKSCSAGMTTVILIGQELSSPFLNVFFLLRAYKGLGNSLTQATFILFASLFFLSDPPTARRQEKPPGRPLEPTRRTDPFESRVELARGSDELARGSDGPLSRPGCPSSFSLLAVAPLRSAARVFINSFGTYLFLREVHRNHLGDASTLGAMAQLEQLLVAVALLAALALQLHWARNIASKIHGALFGKPEKGKSAKPE